MTKKVKPSFKKERRKTDSSLVAERNKTNELSKKYRLTTKHKTNKAVQKERLRADKKTSSSRKEADLKQIIKQKAAKTKPKKQENIDNKKRLATERHLADAAIKLERSRMDIAVNEERKSIETTVNRFLIQERELTDRNLSFERTQTDLQVDQASKLLSDETIEHLKTKVSLTTRDEFLAIVSHDLKNPIGLASSCTQMLLDDPAYEKKNPKLKEWLEFIKENLDISLRLIRNLLDMERVAEGKLLLQMGRYNIGEIIRSSIKYFSNQALNKNISLSLIPSDVSCEFLCDHDRIMQVLFNLIDNALKFTPSGGTITLSVTLSDDQVRVEVRDSGCGIPTEKQEQIFSRFTQLDQKDRRGLGLGLYITKMLVEAHRGSLWVESNDGAGANFIFSLPRRR